MNILSGAPIAMPMLSAFDALAPAPVAGDFEALVLAAQPVAKAVPATPIAKAAPVATIAKSAPATAGAKDIPVMAIANATPITAFADIETKSDKSAGKLPAALDPIPMSHNTPALVIELATQKSLDAKPLPELTGPVLSDIGALLRPDAQPVVAVILCGTTSAADPVLARLNFSAKPSNGSTRKLVGETAFDVASTASSTASWILPTAPARDFTMASLLPAPVPAPVPLSILPPDVGAPVERHLDLAADTIWLDTLARDVAATATQGGRLRFALVPETLGRLDVDVRPSDSGVGVRMTAQNDAARDILTAAQPRLLDDMRANGLRLSAFDIATDASSFAGDTGHAPPRPPVPFDVDPPPRGRAAAAPIPSATPATEGRFA
jgi:flagellar hook-length control protein FliK